MNRSFCGSLMVLVCSGIILFGCGGKVQKNADSGRTQRVQISCIAVMPSSFIGDGEVVPDYMPEVDDQRQGVQAMNEILSDELGGKDRIRFVGLDHISSLTLTGGESQLALARLVGDKMGCNAVLESSVKRFAERIGGRYSVDSPASVAFAMRLIAIENGAILWSAKFDEYQKPVMENLLEWKKANTRGFTWITAKELMREGIRSKLAASPYFSSADK